MSDVNRVMGRPTFTPAEAREADSDEVKAKGAQQGRKPLIKEPRSKKATLLQQVKMPLMRSNQLSSRAPW